MLTLVLNLIPQCLATSEAVGRVGLPVMTIAGALESTDSGS